jgi:cation diffusion facilitator CzcD-associated flavoprotein CzcO
MSISRSASEVQANRPCKALSSLALRVAILGAGPSGIVAAKYAQEHGIIPVVFEKRAQPGGLWAQGTAIWDDMHTNVSKYSVM